jgi:hypothetical protein
MAHVDGLKRRQLNKAERAELARLYDAGLESRELAQRFGLQVKSIPSVARRGGARIRPHGRRPTLTWREHVLALWHQTGCVKAIRRQTKLQESTIIRHLEVAGIDVDAGAIETPIMGLPVKQWRCCEVRYETLQPCARCGQLPAWSKPVAA